MREFEDNLASYAMIQEWYHLQGVPTLGGMGKRSGIGLPNTRWMLPAAFARASTTEVKAQASV